MKKAKRLQITWRRRTRNPLQIRYSGTDSIKQERRVIFSHTPDLTITLIMANVTIHTPTETIFIDMVPKEDAVKLVEFVSRHIVTPENSGDSYNHKEECVDIVNQLERLAALKEKGLLTEDEFTTKKIKLLAR